MAKRNSLEEWTAEVCRIEFGRHAEAVHAYLREFRPRELDRTDAQPVGIVRRDLLDEFRRGANELLRASVWEFLEIERSRRNLTQDQLALRAGVSQGTYSRISSGESSFESIALFLRAMNVPLASLPTPSSTDITIAGLIRSLAFLKTTVFKLKCPVFSQEDAEWLLHMDACPPWQEVQDSHDQRAGALVADCLAASVAIRLRRPVAARPFERLRQLWQQWSGEWEICMAAISTVIREGVVHEPVAQ